MAITIREDYCELCGKNRPLSEAVIDNLTFRVCSDCSKKKSIVEPKKATREDIIRESKLEEVELIVPDYAQRIKQKREEFRLNHRQVAFSISEKESTLQAVESGIMRPSVELAKKIENLFGITLVVKRIEDKKIDFKNKTVTINELLEMKNDFE